MLVWDIRINFVVVMGKKGFLKFERKIRIVVYGVYV